jgi:hypothetical protein
MVWPTSSPSIAHDFSNVQVIENNHGFYPRKMLFIIQCPSNDKSTKLVESVRTFIGD